MVALLQVLQRGRPGDRLRHAELDARAGAEPVEQRIVHAERAMKAVQRIDEHAHRDAARARRGQRRLHRRRRRRRAPCRPGSARAAGSPAIGLEQPAARRRRCPAPPRCGCRRSAGAGRRIEPGGDGPGPVDGAARLARRRRLPRRSPRRNRSCAADAAPRARWPRPGIRRCASAPPCAPAAPHRRASGTSSASPSSSTALASMTTGRSPAAAQPRAERRAAPHRPHAHGQQVGSCPPSRPASSGSRWRR